MRAANHVSESRLRDNHAKEVATLDSNRLKVTGGRSREATPLFKMGSKGKYLNARACPHRLEMRPEVKDGPTFSLASCNVGPKRNLSTIRAVVRIKMGHYQVRGT